MFRFQNFYPQISVHKKYHQYIKNKLQAAKNFKRFVKIGAVVVLGLATAYVLKNHTKLKSFEL